MVTAFVSARPHDFEAAAELALADSRAARNASLLQMTQSFLAYYHAMANDPVTARAKVAPGTVLPMVTLPHLVAFDALSDAIAHLALEETSAAIAVLQTPRDWGRFAKDAARLRVLALVLAGGDARPGELLTLREPRLRPAHASPGFFEYVAVVALLVAGRWHAARVEFRAIDREPAPAFIPLHDVIRTMCEGPPFTGAARVLEGIVDRPFTGFLASVLVRSLEQTVEHIDADGAKPLTAAEHHVLQGIARGWTYEQIAVSRGCSVSTVKGHATSVFRKLGTPGNRLRTVHEARERGLLRES
jgi:DNA-binding CsgD family transcriptional regulator